MALRDRLSSVRDWLILTGVVVVLVALTWLVGGFQPATATGRSVAVGEQIELQRWQLTVQAASYTDQARAGYDVEPRIRIVMQVTNLDRSSQLAPTSKMITVRAGSRVLTEEQIATSNERSYNFDPDVPAALVYDFRWPPENAADPPVPPGEITVIIRDEREAQNFVYDHYLVAGDAVATVRLACPDVRVSR